MTNNPNYTPNQVTLSSRLLRTAGAVVLIAHGVIGIVRDDVIVPAKRSALHLHGLSGWVTAGAMFCAAVVLLAVVIDHFDRRDNEAAYQQFGRWMSRAGWMLMGLGMGLQIAGLKFPAPSSVTTAGVIGGLFVFLCTAAIGLANEKAVERAAPPPVLVPPASDVPKVGVDRSFAGLLLMVVGALVFLAVLPGLVKFELIQYVVAALAVVLMVAGWLVFSGRRKAKSADGVADAGKTRNWRPIRIGVLVIVGLAAIWYAKVSQWGQWLDSDEAERRQAPVWAYDFDDFTGGMPQTDIQKYLSAEGYRMRCYGNLGPNEKIGPDDTSVCWTIVQTAYGIPARMMVFSFRDDRLQGIRQDFPREEWPAVREWLRKQGDADAGSFGRDQFGVKVIGRRGKTGLILSADPGLGGWTMVLWRPREQVLTGDCRSGGESNSQWKLLCRDWPAPTNPSNFVLRHRPPEQRSSEGAPATVSPAQGQS